MRPFILPDFVHSFNKSYFYEQPEGITIAGFVIITDVGLFGTFTGHIAAWLMNAHRPK
jgi:hypothetical protein